MSEEIIIDGVNVAECRFLDEWKHCDICEKLCDSKCLIVEDIECKTYDNCYYKQLKRLQAENKENLHYLACMTEQRNKLQTENEKKDNLLKWLITQQYYILPKNIKLKIKEVLK